MSLKSLTVTKQHAHGKRGTPSELRLNNEPTQTIHNPNSQTNLISLSSE